MNLKSFTYIGLSLGWDVNVCEVREEECTGGKGGWGAKSNQADARSFVMYLKEVGERRKRPKVGN